MGIENSGEFCIWDASKLNRFANVVYWAAYLAASAAWLTVFFVFVLNNRDGFAGVLIGWLAACIVSLCITVPGWAFRYILTANKSLHPWVMQ
jgi:hypothetical protein